MAMPPSISISLHNESHSTPPLAGLRLDNLQGQLVLLAGIHDLSLLSDTPQEIVESLTCMLKYFNVHSASEPEHHLTPGSAVVPPVHSLPVFALVQQSEIMSILIPRLHSLCSTPLKKLILG